MLKLLLGSILILVSNTLLAQGLVLENLSAGYFNSYVYSDKGSSIPEGINTWDDENDYLNVKINFKYKKFFFSSYFTSYGGRTAWTVQQDKFTYSDVAGKVYCFNIGISKDLIPKTKYINLEPFVSLGLQKFVSNKSGTGFGLDFHGPIVYSVTEPYTEKRNVLQFIPSAGFRFYTIIGKTILFGIDAQFTYAFIPYDKIYFDYYTRYDPTIKTAEFVSTGTGFFVCPFIGINLNKRK